MPATTVKGPYAQPRIPGVKRFPRHTCLAPVIHHMLTKLAMAENKSMSYVAAELIGDLIGIDAATGEPLPKGEQSRRYREIRRIFLKGRKR